MNETINTIMSRRSCRSFDPERMPSDEVLQQIAEAGTWAPTGMGLQNPLIIVVTNKALRDRISRMNAEIMGTDSNPYYNAPTIVLVFAPAVKDNRNSVQDGSLILGTMMLAAHSIGLASCWINREMEMFATGEGIEIMKELGIPEGYIGIGALSLGYSAIPNPKALPRKDNYYKIVK